MAIVSISKAAKITGKARSTIQSYIRQGKLSKTTDPVSNDEGIDTSELIRVFGALKNTGDTPVQKKEIIQDDSPHNTAEINIKIIRLEAEIEKLNTVLSAKEKHIESLDKAIQLLEDQRQKTPKTEHAEPKYKGFFHRLFKE